MTSTIQTCDQQRLEHFLLGDLTTTAERELTSHLDECIHCRDQLEHLAAEPASWNEAESLLKSQPFDEIDAHEHRSLQIQSVLDALAPTDDPAMLGRLGAHEVSGVVGAGAMGVVLKAVDPSLDRIVAIKVMAPHLASSGAARQRFAREAKAAAAVLHPNVIAIHSVSNDESLPSLVMPYVRGASLQKRLDNQGPLPVSEILRIGSQIAAGLGAAHAQGLVHRDIKPANILLEEGVERVAITDFGLARAVDDATMTRSGVIAGTPQYMSPEQARGDSIDQRSDLFSLGSVLYAMCTGRAPFRAETSYGVLRRITDEEPRLIREINPDIPDWLAAIIAKLMSKQPGDRFESAQGVAELLEGCLAHVQQPMVVPLPESLDRPSRRSRPFSITRRSSGVIAMLATLGFGLLGMLCWQAAEPPDVSGRWAGEDWGEVVLKMQEPGQYTGTYTDTFGKAAGTLQLEWSRIEGRFKGKWAEGKARHGRISIRLVDDEIRGAWTTSIESGINPGTPELADLQWTRSRRGSSHVALNSNGATVKGPGPGFIPRPNQESSRDPNRARSAVETYVAAGLAGDTSKAAGVARNSPGSARQIEEFAENLNVKRLAIEWVYVSDNAKSGAALAISESVTLTDPNPDGQDTGVLVFTLVRSKDAWYVNDIDFESEKGAEDEMKRFFRQHPEVVVLPLDTTNPAAETGSTIPQQPVKPAGEDSTATAIPNIPPGAVHPIEFRLADVEPSEGLIEHTVVGTNQKVFVAAKPFATIFDLSAIQMIDDAAGHPALEITFRPESAQRLASITGQHLNRPVAILVDGKVLSAPVLRDRISSQAVISGQFNREAAAQIATGISSRLEVLKAYVDLGVSDADAEPVWGEPVNGLQLGMRGIHSGRHFQPGETIRFRLHVRNVGKEPVRFQYVRSKNCRWVAPLVETSDGKRVRIHAMLFRGGHNTFVESLEPDQVVAIHVMGILALGESESAHKWWPRIEKLDPGDFRLTAGILPFYLVDSDGNPADKHFALTSGTVSIHVDRTEE